MPYRRDYRFLEHDAVLQVRSDRSRFRPYGLYGGGPGAASRNVLNPQAEARVLDSKLLMDLGHGDVFRHELAGGGGWGDPLERDPASVLEDVRDEFVSRDGAARDYGVVLDTRRWTVDRAATDRLRARVRAGRTAPLPVVSRGAGPGAGGDGR